MHIGAEVDSGGTRFRVWAPRRQRVRVVLEGETVELSAEADGYFSAHVTRAHAGDLYQFLLDSDDKLYPDPASRFQPSGPHGPSQIVDPRLYRWREPRLGGRAQGQVLYELHVGTFTEPGTFEAAAAELPQLAKLGITAVELMPVNEFAGAFNWGYDGVSLFAPSHNYGSHDDLRTLVDQAHACGLRVLLDVVYNHLGADGNYLGAYSPYYFSCDKTEWGDGLNFDGINSRAVRDFFTANAAYWIREFRLDGLRLDATQSLSDSSPVHIVTDIACAARAQAAEPLLIIGENEPQDCRLLQPVEQGGSGLDALWNDDFHHAARVALTGHNDAYFSGYRGSPQEFISATQRGFLFQGQYFRWQHKPRGTPTRELPASAFVAYLENHDQVANSGAGRRLAELCSPAELRALTALLLLGPQTPLLFQGQEFGSRARFVFFADHDGELAEATRKGRIEFLSQFPALRDEEAIADIPQPHQRAAFEVCKLRREHKDERVLALHADLIRMRSTDAAFSAQRRDCIHGAVLSDRAFALRFCMPQAEERLLVINLGVDLTLVRAAEPLLAPPAGSRWCELWSSEAARYGGGGVRRVADNEDLTFQGRSAAVLRPADNHA